MATFRLREYSRVWIGGIKVKVQMKTGMFKQALCEITLPECFMQNNMPYLVVL